VTIVIDDIHGVSFAGVKQINHFKNSNDNEININKFSNAYFLTGSMERLS
jgi:hypothetical protein